MRLLGRLLLLIIVFIVGLLLLTLLALAGLVLLGACLSAPIAIPLLLIVLGVIAVAVGVFLLIR